MFLFERIISIIAECSSSDDRTLVNNAYACLNHCLEQLIKFCQDALFVDPDEEQAIRKLYKKFGYPIVPLAIESNHLFNFIKNEKSNVKEVHLTAESSALDKVNYYIYQLKTLLKTSDQQHITTVSDFDDALLQFASFVSNGKSIESSQIDSFYFLCRIFLQNDIIIRYINSRCDKSRWDLCDNDLVFMVLLSTTIAQFIRFEFIINRWQSNELIFEGFSFKILFEIKNAFVTDVMNSGLMLCIEPDWMDTLYEVHFEEFDLFEDLSEQFKIVLHQMLTGILNEYSHQTSPRSFSCRHSTI